MRGRGRRGRGYREEGRALGRRMGCWEDRESRVASQGAGIAVGWSAGLGTAVPLPGSPPPREVDSVQPDHRVSFPRLPWWPGSLYHPLRFWSESREAQGRQAAAGKKMIAGSEPERPLTTHAPPQASPHSPLLEASASGLKSFPILGAHRVPGGFLSLL